MRRDSNWGFSLIEIVLALGIISFALLSVIALLPIGIITNRVSVEETRASHILTAVESDLRNSYPMQGKSQFFLLPSPYAPAASGLVINQQLTAQTLYSVELGDTESPVTGNQPPIFRVSIIYISVPGAGTLQPAEGRLVVNWPPLANPTLNAITDRSQVSGYVEAYVTFPSP
jgi:uncharacterized protein (TIGR02598 family)